MPRATSAARRRPSEEGKPTALPDLLEPLIAAPPEGATLLQTAYALSASLVRWTWALVWPILLIAALAWATGAGHWLLMTAYSAMGCHSVSFIGFLQAAFSQGRPECVLIWRLAEVAHWTLFDLFGRILAAAVPAAA